MALDWDERYVVRKTLVVTGTAALSHNLKATASEDNGDGTAKVHCDAHGYLVGSQIYITGTSTVLAGLRTLTAVGTNDFSFAYTGTFVAETPPGDSTETVRVVLAPVIEDDRRPFQLREVRLHLDGVPTTSGYVVITLDAGAGSAFDVVVRRKDMAGVDPPDWDWSPDAILRYTEDDALVFTWANADGDTYGLEIVYDQLT